MAVRYTGWMRARIAASLALLVGCVHAPARVVPPAAAVTPARELAEPRAVATAGPAPSPIAVTPVEPVSSVVAVDPDRVVPLSSEQRAIFHGSPEDAAPEIRGGITKALEDVSYIVGNEWTLDAFAPTIANKRGGYVGVGPDQAYLFIGWQRPELAWLVDYDDKVLRVHAMYAVLLARCETRAEFLAAFEPAAGERIAKAIAAEVDDSRVRRLYRNNREMFRFRLRSLERGLRRRGVASWLTDDETYRYVRDMVLAGRVRAMRVNLLERAGVDGIVHAAEQLGVPIRVVYLSNAEEYWDSYAPQFVANVGALPIDDDSVLLRTTLVWDVNRDYVYNVQSLANYRRWLAVAHDVADIIGSKPQAERGKINLVHTTGEPAAAR